MPYSNIVYIKLLVNLLDGEDSARFLFELNESQQLVYIKMLLLAGRTQNNIPINMDFIKNKFNYKGSDIKTDIDNVMRCFPKLKENSTHYYFENFDNLHNLITKEHTGNSKGTPKELQRIAPDKSKIREDKNREDKSKSGACAPKPPAFQIPTLQEVQDYITEHKYRVDAMKFHAHYTANGWRVGKNPMKNWKAAIVTWSRT